MEGQFGGFDVSEAKRLRALEDENTRLKRVLADFMLDNVALKDLSWGRSGDARGEAETCRSSARRIRDERTAGV